MAALTARRRRTVSVAVASTLLALAGCSSTSSPSEQGTVVDLLRQDWGHVPGVVVDGAGLRVTATGRSIVEQDGGGGQPDPPVNLAGTHLVAPEDFTLQATFTDVTADATLAVYDSPP